MREGFMKITTSQFGELEVDKNDIINFKDGILGFEHLKRFFIIDPNDENFILWLQSLDNGETAFPILEPGPFLPEYQILLLPTEMASLNLKSEHHTSAYIILTIPRDIEEVSANLKAPIIINNKTKSARQIVLQNNKLEVRYPMYKDLKKNLMRYSSDDRKRTSIDAPDAAQTAKTSIDKY